MEYPFSPQGGGAGYWPSPSPRTQLNGSTSLDGGMSNSVSDYMPNSFSDPTMFDPYAGLCPSPSMTDQVLASMLQSPNGFNCGQLFATEVGGSYNAKESSSPNYGEKVVFQQMDPLLCFFDDADAANNLKSEQKINGSSQELGTFDTGNYIISRPPSLSLDERMLRALSFLKESAGGGILAQVWVPMKHGDQFVLSTTEQPYLLDQMLAGYREVSRAFTFSAEGKLGSFQGLPGRVFISKVPEWTSNIGYYNRSEYLRMDHAIRHDVRGSIAFPISDMQSELPCCAVLELVTTKEKSDFDEELEMVSHALQNVHLTTTMPPRLLPQCLSTNKRAALTEIVDVLRSLCHAHSLPLALTWIPCCYTDGIGGEDTRIHIKEGHSSPTEKCILCIEESACYVTDRAMEGFVHACIEHHLEEGKGIAGKALQSNHPFFYPDVKTYDISEYPLVHHARKYNLNAAVAVRLRSAYTNDDDYILEFFLPLSMKGSSEQQLLLDNLSGTMQKICMSLRTVSDAELSSRTEGSQMGFEKKNVPRFSPMSRRNSQIPLVSSNHDLVHKMSIKASSNQKSNGIEPSHSQETNGSRGKVEKTRSEKNVSLSLLQQYFSGTLKDAAKGIGVCPTTLKRMCRKHGISRWPSRKIKKVNRSLKKIQTVLDTVQGVEGGLKFDPSMEAIVAGKSHKTLMFHEKSTLKSPESVTAKENDKKCGLNVEKAKYSSSLIDEHNHTTTSVLTDSSNESKSFENQKNSKDKSAIADNISGSKSKILLVKATYGEDTIRFKFDQSWGYLKLYEEIATRFKLQNGSFQLKYLDDEDEWVMLLDDSDLQECVEILDEIVTRSVVKILVRDVACNLSSSSSSSCFLAT